MLFFWIRPLKYRELNRCGGAIFITLNNSSHNRRLGLPHWLLKRNSSKTWLNFRRLLDVNSVFSFFSVPTRREALDRSTDVDEINLLDEGQWSRRPAAQAWAPISCGVSKALPFQRIKPLGIRSNSQFIVWLLSTFLRASFLLQWYWIVIDH